MENCSIPAKSGDEIGLPMYGWKKGGSYGCENRDRELKV